MRQYGGENQDGFFKELTDAECALPPRPPKGGSRNRKTRRRKQKSKKKYTRR
jgi:hypothetical protein